MLRQTNEVFGYDLGNFSLSDMASLGGAVRRSGAGAQSMEEAAGEIVRKLYDELAVGETRQKSCALIRLFKTHDFRGLDGELKEFARKLMPDVQIEPKTKCLVLLASAGEKPQWNSRQGSNGHKAIPLPSEEIVLQIPMIKNLIKQFGLDVNSVLNPDPNLILDAEHRTYNVFHIEKALGSKYIPAQKEFIAPLAIKSVLGFGGVLPLGDMFAAILFSKIRIPEETAKFFESMSLNLKTALLPFEEAVFK